MTGRGWRPGRALPGLAVLLLAVAVAGPGAVPQAVRSVDAPTLAAGAAIAAVTTTAGAWRWCVVARRLGVGLSLPAAVSGSYRAQFLNATLPGGVLGDVDRGVGHGRTVGDVGRALRAVAWERAWGYLVLVVLTAAGLLGAGVGGPSPTGLRWSALVVVLGVAVAVAARRVPGARRAGRVVLADARRLLAPGVAATSVGTSTVVVAGHVATFALAARAVGVRVDLGHLVPVALVVLLVGALPVNLAGWGPREAAATWAFTGAGLEAADGLSVAVVYGLVALVATLPGAVVVLVGRVRGSTTGSAPARGPLAPHSRAASPAGSRGGSRA